ncbi:TonB-dependent receptor [Parahaliea mediterranea]|uniref:TonB-dependent receptor n=1 Tax=Parahaliea mediterranea TaxID=651086 RepID=A0A939DCJ1_9GAMM|nr:TonB-dependent receptor [Parahaliea mediterranea]MBN7795534.1 TonB-dependent receptor [Parahaliea mediterranea]
MKKRTVATDAQLSRFTWQRAVCVLGLMSPPLTVSPLAFAQQVDARPVTQGMLEEVIVTAEKRSESLQDTPISLVALGSGELETLSIGDIDDIGANVPNFRTTPHPNSATTPRVYIRGVGNFDDQITQDPSVAVYLDSVYMGRTQGMGMEVADLERVEILRGPQGTHYGRNATGGAVNFITVAPEIGRWQFKQQLSLGNRNKLLSKTMVNVPITDELAVKGYYLTAREDGFIDNRGVGEARYGDEDRDAQRLDVKWTPTDSLDLRYGFDRSHIGDTPDYLMPSTLGVSVDRPHASHAGSQDIQPNDATTGGHQLTLSWFLDNGTTLRSITSYRELDSYVYQDYLSGTGRPNTPFYIDSWVDQDQLSQELQLLGSALDERLEYTLGLYYFEEDGDGETLNWLPGFGIRQYSLATIENSARAAYGEVTYTPDILQSRLHVTAGLRWSQDKRRAQLLRNNQLNALDIVIPGSQEQGAGSRDFSDLTPTITLAYDLGDHTNIYAKAGEGYKTGGFNIRATTMTFFEDGFGEESLRSYELGLKAEWLQNRLRTNIAVFLADYEDIQLNAQTVLDDPSKADILNAGDASIEGVELDVTAVLGRGFTLGFNYAYLNASYNEIRDGLGRDVTDHYEFVNAPENSFRANLAWDIAETPLGSLQAYLNYSWLDDRYITATTLNGRYTIDAYGLVDARLTLAGIPGLPAGGLRVALWGKNLADEEYAYLNGPTFGGITAWGEPRSYGVDVIYEY